MIHAVNFLKYLVTKIKNKILNNKYLTYCFTSTTIGFILFITSYINSSYNYIDMSLVDVDTPLNYISLFLIFHGWVIGLVAVGINELILEIKKDYQKWEDEKSKSS